VRTAVIDHLQLRYLQGRTPSLKDLSLRQGDRADAGARPFLTLIRSAAASGSSHAIHPSARVPGALLKGCDIPPGILWFSMNPPGHRRCSGGRRAAVVEEAVRGIENGQGERACPRPAPQERRNPSLRQGCAIYSQRSQVYSSALQAAWSRRYSGGAKGRFPARIGWGIQDAACGLPRSLLPRRWVNKGKKKGRGLYPRPGK
jgi:hypothetical protein